MASSVSETSICNLAMQLLGAERITALDQASRNARSCNACYALLRDRELSRQAWRFAKRTAALAASATTPEDDDFAAAYPLPSDFLRLIKPKDRPDLDWEIVNHLGSPAIVSNDGAPLKIQYVGEFTDPTKFHMTFVYALACAIAEHLAEELTQSNSKKADAQQKYRDWIAEAKKQNAFVQAPAVAPEDDWLSVRR